MPWKPIEGDDFWFLELDDEEVIRSLSWKDGFYWRDAAFKNHNCFRTREHAELALKYVKEALNRAHEEIEKV